jgi:hypothetical protein
MTTHADSASSPLPLLTRSQQAQVAADEANARKAAADADTAALQFAQAKYKSLVPDLTGVALNAVNDKSAEVAFSGLVTYSALNHAAEVVAYRISTALPKPADDGPQPAILVTSQSDLLTNDLLESAVREGLNDLIAFAEKALNVTQPRGAEEPADGEGGPRLHIATLPPLTVMDVGLLPKAASIGLAAAGGAAVTAGFGPFGLAAAAAAAIPSIVSLFSSTTTVKSQGETLTDLATTTSVVSAVAEKLPRYVAVHEDFRLAPATSEIRSSYQELTEKRAALVLGQEQVQAAGNAANLALARAQRRQDMATKATPRKPEAADGAAPREPGDAGPANPDDADLAKQVADETAASANAAAALSLITSAISSIDAFTGALNATSAGTRSPLAIASLNELLRQDGDDRISYVLSVKGLGGQSQEYCKDRRIGSGTYTTIADASIAFMLYDTAAKKIISSGVANGVSSVHGKPGKPPTGLLGPNAADAIADMAADSPPSADGEQSGPWRSRWRRMFGGD